jgi:hypothetical protein
MPSRRDDAPERFLDQHRDGDVRVTLGHLLHQQPVQQLDLVARPEQAGVGDPVVNAERHAVQRIGRVGITVPGRCNDQQSVTEHDLIAPGQQPVLDHALVDVGRDPIQAVDRDGQGVEHRPAEVSRIHD